VLCGSAYCEQYEVSVLVAVSVVKLQNSTVSCTAVGWCFSTTGLRIFTHTRWTSFVICKATVTDENQT